MQFRFSFDLQFSSKFQTRKHKNNFHSFDFHLISSLVVNFKVENTKIYFYHFNRVCRAIQIDQMVTRWEMQVEENAKLPPSQRVPMLKSSDDLVTLPWEASALGALQEAGEAYLIGIQHLMKCSVNVQMKFSRNSCSKNVQLMYK